MKRIFQGFLLLLIAIVSFKCQKEFSSGNTIPIGSNSNNQSAPVTATLQGNVLDENGKAASGVMITVGAQTAVTGSDGYFRITDAMLDKNASLVTAELNGYFKGYRVFRASEAVNQVVIKLIKKDLAGTVDAGIGGEATLSNGAKISLPANGVTLASGGAYSGAVNIYAAYINPESREIGKVIPGSLIADDKNQQRVILQSFGMLAVELESATGQKLQVSANSVASLTMPIPSALFAGAPSEISLWYVDEHTGIWKEQGTAKKNGNEYKGEVKHFSYWNCDIALPGIAFKANVETSDGSPLRNASVIIRVATNAGDSAGGGCAHGYTDSLGQVSGLIPANKNLLLEIVNECYQLGFSKNIGPFSQNTDLGTITVPDAGPFITRFSGRLMSCSNTPVSDGHAVLHFNGMAFYMNTDVDGKFSTSVVTCAGGTQSATILGVDATIQQQSSMLTIPITSSQTDAGDIIACGTSSAQFMKYTLDGVKYALNGSADSLISFGEQNGAGSFSSFIRASQYPNGILNFNFYGANSAGSYPVNTLFVNTFNNTQLTQPFNVLVTAYPRQSGDFYEGSFSGSFTDSSTAAILHTIDCSFRVKKY